MAITNLSIPYPDFKLHEVIDPEQFDFNNGAIVEKVNTALVVVNQVEGIKDTADMGTVAMVNHKLSADHDFRYYTEAEIDNTLSILKGAGYSGDTLVGLKTLITGLQTQITNLNTTYSTDAERISAVNNAIAQFQLADGQLTTLINNKANVADVYTKAQTDVKVWGTSSIADRAITSIKLALQNVKNEHIQDFSITADKFHPDLLEEASVAVLSGKVGDLSTLQTTVKTSLVHAINEIKTSLDSISTTGSSTSIVDAGNYYTATNVEGALQEVGLAFNGARGNLVTSVTTMLGS